jgi:PAS domain S-box-containing protein
MKEFLEKLFWSDFMPHGYCYSWKPGLVWLHVVSDVLIALAYFSIPITLAYFIRKRRDLPFNWMFVSFGIFILACGTTHIMEVWTLWHGTYWLSGAIKVVTAMASVPTAILLVQFVPQMLALPSPEALRLEIAERKRAEEALHQANNELEMKVLERTAELRNSEKELLQLIDAIPQQVLVFDSNWSPLFANRRELEYTGLTREEAQSKDAVARIFHTEDLKMLEVIRERALLDGVPFEFEARIRGTDRQYRWFLIRHNPLRDEQGRVTRWYGTRTDIEDRKRAEESLHKALDEIKKLRDQLYKENIALREEVDKASMFEEIVGASPGLQAVLERVAKVAPTDSTVLITGETGTGKELIARAIHRRSQRSSRAFVSVNCATIPRDLIGSELFGHEKGAFTGALHRRAGRFEIAEGGTIFLDEVDEIPPETQIALLRVLQEREFERVGGNQTIRADVRVIAATNRDLETAIAVDAFRTDLYYRVNVFPIEMPPLRERKEDISMLVEYFIDRYARRAGKKIRTIDKKTMELLQSYSWPGNIRELQNVIERSVIVCDTETFFVDKSWLAPESAQTGLAGQPLSKRPVAQEKKVIEAALVESRGRVAGPSGAAARLGIPPSTLESKIRALKISKYRFKGG